MTAVIPRPALSAAELRRLLAMLRRARRAAERLRGKPDVAPPVQQQPAAQPPAR